MVNKVVFEKGTPVTAAERNRAEAVVKKGGGAREVERTLNNPPTRKVASKGSWTLPPSVTKHPK